MQKIVKDVRVKNAQGLHTRPATLIVKTLSQVKSCVFFTHKKETIDAKSIISILMLAAPKNALITITCEGEDAEKTMDELIDIFENKFGE